MRLLMLRRAYTKFGTLSDFRLDGSAGEILQGHTIELPWQDNATDVSCIPEGSYNAIRHRSPTFGPCLWLQDVPERTEILVHAANSPTDLNGCIGPGDSYGWAGDYWDGIERPLREELAVWSSGDTLERMLEAMADEGAEEIEVEIRPWRPEYP
ncbi:MAG: DUF5675 family protein [Thiohalorhabdus sp.]